VPWQGDEWMALASRKRRSGQWLNPSSVLLREGKDGTQISPA